MQLFLGGRQVNLRSPLWALSALPSTVGWVLALEVWNLSSPGLSLSGFVCVSAGWMTFSCVKKSAG